VFILTCADGTPCPIIIIVPTKEVPKDLLQFQSEWIKFIPSFPKGWMTRVTFEYIAITIVVDIINKQRREKKMLDAPAMILGDGHGSRESGEVFNELVNNNVFFLCYPPHTSGLLSSNDQDTNAVFKGGVSHEEYDASDNAAEKRASFMRVAMQAGFSASLSNAEVLLCTL
jgi:hypothetical protein